MEIISRSTWGARHRAGFGPRGIGALERWLHHSVTKQLGADATPEQEHVEMRGLERIGQARFGAGISYTLAVFPSGRVYEGTGITRRGAHTDGRNTIAAGIVLVGNYEEHEPTPQMLSALAELLRHGVDAGWWRSATFTGAHRKLKSTACPGRHAFAKMAFVEGLAALGGGGMSAPAPAPATPAPAPTSTRSPRPLAVVAQGSTGPAVKLWQRVLQSMGYDIGRAGADGDFGPATKRATVAFQRNSGLEQDGVVGEMSWLEPIVRTGDRVLRQGDHGPVVGVWQNVAGVTPDEVFGPQTDGATREVQRHVGTADDGIVGADTVGRVRGAM